ncbi:relaxase/mobilization nuclease domain-containing protein [Gloeothece verrucosa]|uniref:Relaxase/mobilization nuclease family protein n=1 Tax=Gloeothece verrucosa (strain PCC 7822) TaxID=497965 RepID=E0UNG9_GLOV7|nr:relaxase/mobilization nuclease domain-containing protein [Gloeothece verrucosa]ADN18499.1 Relaxase/mobilization nuclease family protein [Gloeothece verrucosa PCC 7822]
MIAKQIKGTNFYGCLAYVLGRTGHVVIDSNVNVTSPAELATHFEVCCHRNPRVTRPVYHAMLSLVKGEKLDPLTWKSVASDFMRHQKFHNVPYLVVQHNEKDHDHIHIVAARVRSNGTCVSDSWDYIEGQKAVRHLEEKYGLQTPVPKRYKLRDTEGVKLDDYSPPDKEKDKQHAYNLLKTTIDSVYPHSSSLVDLATMLRQQDIELGIRKTQRTNTVQGVRYQIGKFNFSGTQLGKDYTLPGLTYKSRRSHQLTFNPTTDLALIESLKNLQFAHQLEQIQIQQEVQIELEADEFIEIRLRPRSRGR